MLDGNSRQNLATFCQTWVDDEIRDLMSLAPDTALRLPAEAAPKKRLLCAAPWKKAKPPAAAAESQFQTSTMDLAIWVIAP